MGKVLQFVQDGDVGCGAPDSPEWHRAMILQLEGDELRDYVLTIGVEKTIEALDGDGT